MDQILLSNMLKKSYLMKCKDSSMKHSIQRDFNLLSLHNMYMMEQWYTETPPCIFKQEKCVSFVICMYCLNGKE